MACRNIQAGIVAQKEMIKASLNKEIYLLALDLSSFAAVYCNLSIG
jgi:hypothetical protein